MASGSGSSRFRVEASGGGRLFSAFPLDVGFRARRVERTEQLTTGEWFTFADIAPVSVDALPLELHVAEWDPDLRRWIPREIES